jgi:hypothetical protein
VQSEGDGRHGELILNFHFLIGALPNESLASEIWEVVPTVSAAVPGLFAYFATLRKEIVFTLQI